MSGQPSYCAWNTTYAEDTECPLGGLADERMLEGVLACDSLPQTCLDWCDAYMYCQWAGKHLCGSRRDGTRIPLEQVATLESEWYIACSAGEQNRYGAGDFERTSASCNTLECYRARTCVFPTDLVFATGAPVAPGSMRDCQPPQPQYDGVYDMTGNVQEWENACDGETGPDDQCAAGEVPGGPVHSHATSFQRAPDRLLCISWASGAAATRAIDDLAYSHTRR